MHIYNKGKIGPAKPEKTRQILTDGGLCWGLKGLDLLQHEFKFPQYNHLISKDKFASEKTI